MTKYKMITCDLDGTLYNSKDEISRENNEAIKEFAKMGIPFVPCTGRTLSEMKDAVENPDVRYIIYSTGAAILDKKTGERLVNGLFGETKENVLAILGEYEYFTFAHGDGKVFVDKTLLGREREFHLNGTLCGIIENVADHSTDFINDVMKAGIECLTVFFKDHKDYEECKSKLQALGNVAVSSPWEYNLEIYSINAGKDKAIKILADRLGINADEVISAGDSDNDINAIKFAGLGISTSNGSEEIKKIADEIACSNDEHIAKYILEKYFK